MRLQVSFMTAAALVSGLATSTLMTPSAFGQSVIKIDGSSTVFPITEAVAEEFQTAKKGKMKVTVGISGTGGGFKKFCRGETDVQDASRPILKEEMDACKKAGIEYIELPIAFDAMVIVVNPKNDWMKDIKVEDLKKMYEPAAQGKVTKWNQVRKEWPDAPLKLFGTGSDSGTFDYFTEAVVGKAKACRGDYTASADQNTLVQGIASDKNAIGFVAYAYYISNQSKLKALGVIGGEKAPKKEAVLPSAETVEKGTYFPLSRPLFIYVSTKSLARPEVKEFSEFYIKSAAAMSKGVKYVPLPAEAYEMASAHLAKNRVGTVFGGVPEVGIEIKELLKRESKN